MPSIVVFLLSALIGVVLYAIAYPCITTFVREIDKEEAKMLEEDVNEEEDDSIWYSFVFGDILFDYILLRFVKYWISFFKNKEKTSFDLKKQGVLAVWGAAISCAIVANFGVTIGSVLSCVFVWILTMITVIDFMRMEIPPALNGLIYILGLVAIFVMPEVSLTSRLIGMLIISIPMQLIVFAVPGGFGGGDIKLMFVAGLFLGLKGIIAGFFIGLVLGGAYGALQLALRKLGRKEHFAFGPFLSVGMIVSLFLGNSLIQWYLSAFLGR